MSRANVNLKIASALGWPAKRAGLIKPAEEFSNPPQPQYELGQPRLIFGHSDRLTPLLQSLRDWLGSMLPPGGVLFAAMLMVMLPLVLLMIAIGWTAKFFGYSVDQALAVARIWRINIGVAIILALSKLSVVLEDACATSGVLAKLCGL